MELNDDSSLKLIKRKELSQNLIFEECSEKKLN